MPLDARTHRAADPYRPPDHLPSDPARFFRSAPPPPPPPQPPSHPTATPHPPEPADNPVSALDRLGASPLPKTGFPFIGFLSGVYEHVAQVARGETPPKDP